jgi:hypothetical protein
LSWSFHSFRARRQDQALHMPASASLGDVQAALAELAASEAILIFPASGAAALLRQGALAALRTFCRERGLDVIVIGGDEALRAAAVAEGFAAATSLDSWQAEMSELARNPVAPSAEAWVEADSALVAKAGDQADSTAWDVDPPSYVLRLLAGEGTYAGPRDEPTPEEAARLSPEDTATDPLIRAHHEYEERMTTTIRDTGGMAPQSGQ